MAEYILGLCHISIQLIIEILFIVLCNGDIE